MRNLFVTFCSLIFLALSASAQKQDSTNNTNPDWVVKPQQRKLVSTGNVAKASPEWTQKLKYGGNFWLSVGNGAYIDISPMVGYQLNENGTLAGVGLNMIYTNNRIYQTSNFDYGIRAFLQQPIFNIFFLHGEIEIMNAQSQRFVDNIPITTATPTQAEIDAQLKRKWEASPLVGFGVSPGKIRGGDGGYYIALLYNLNYPNSGYNGSTNLGGGISLRVGSWF
jgi:hypothetical protein